MLKEHKMGPLQGIKIVEFEGIGPGPLAAMILADMGAEVTVIQRPQAISLKAQLGGQADLLSRGKQSQVIDLKSATGVAEALSLIANADALIEGNRPGVMERLSLGPEVCLVHNPRLVYGRLTGWGQDGPLAQAAGHDLNYVALTGFLSLSKRGNGLPIVPPTLVGDSSGALGMAFGIVCAILEARTSGQGQVVDAAIVDIVAHMGSLAHSIKASGQLGGERPSPFHDSPFYDAYACADGKCLTVGALEPQFYALLLEKLGLSDVDARAQYDVQQWPALKERVAAIFRTKTRDAWCTLLEGSDICFAPVLDMDEAACHPHNVARGTFKMDGGFLQAAPAPRFSRSKL
jgi:alpha-methylacyl-CoA racemase